MSAQQGQADHHVSATGHHDQAARLHREASRHYGSGTDFAHAAHLALVAHGHAMRAIGHGTKASSFYAEHDGAADRAARSPAAATAFDPTGATHADLDSARHHAAAADLHERAARHHSQASKYFHSKNFAQAAREAQIAHSYAHQSLFHGNEAAMHHVEHHAAWQVAAVA